MLLGFISLTHHTFWRQQKYSENSWTLSEIELLKYFNYLNKRLKVYWRILKWRRLFFWQTNKHCFFHHQWSKVSAWSQVTLHQKKINNMLWPLLNTSRGFPAENIYPALQTQASKKRYLGNPRQEGFEKKERSILLFNEKKRNNKK